MWESGTKFTGHMDYSNYLFNNNKFLGFNGTFVSDISVIIGLAVQQILNRKVGK